MSKKSLKSSELSQNSNNSKVNKNTELKKYISPAKNISNNNLNNLTRNKFNQNNIVPKQTIKKEIQIQQGQTNHKKELFKSQHLKESQCNQNDSNISNEIHKKKKFNKNSVIPTLKSTPLSKNSNQQYSQKLKITQQNESIVQSSIQTQKQELNNESDTSNERPKSDESDIKIQNQALKQQVKQLKQQNQKLIKKVERFRLLTEENKKTMKQKIEFFNHEGQNIRKMKAQTLQLQTQISQLKSKLINLQKQNFNLSQQLKKYKMPKIQSQTQTDKLQQFNDGFQINNPQIYLKEKDFSRNYESTSSRKSFGGILPLQTVIKQYFNQNKNNLKVVIKNDHISKTQDLTKNKQQNELINQISEEKRKCLEQQIFQQNKQQSKNRVKVKYECFSDMNLCNKDNADENLSQIQINNFQYEQSYHQISQYLKSRRLFKQGQFSQIQICQKNINNKFFKKDNGSVSKQQNLMKKNNNNYNPSILIQNYKKIAQQEQLIQSLYRVIEELTYEIQKLQKTIISLSEYRLRQKKKQIKESYKQRAIQINQLMNGNNQSQHRNQLNFNYQEQNCAKQNKIEQQNYEIQQTLLLDCTVQNQLKLQNELKLNYFNLKQLDFYNKKTKQNKNIKANLNNSNINNNSNIHFNIKQQKLQCQSLLINKNRQQQQQTLKQSMDNYNIDILIEDISRFVHSEIISRRNISNIMQKQQKNIYQKNIYQKNTYQKNIYQKNIYQKNIQQKNILCDEYVQKMDSEELQQKNDDQIIEGDNQRYKKQDQIQNDSLEALQYFQANTPENISSEVSHVDQNKNKEENSNLDQLITFTYIT